MTFFKLLVGALIGCFVLTSLIKTKRLLGSISMYMYDQNADNIVFGRSGGGSRDNNNNTSITTTTNINGDGNNHNNNDTRTNNNNYCQTTGSMHQVALDMIQYSSPNGSASLQKLHQVVSQYPQFYFSWKKPIFNTLVPNIVDLLRGYGLTQVDNVNNNNNNSTGSHNNNNNPSPLVLLVEGIFGSSLCPIVVSSKKRKRSSANKDCWNSTRIIVQSEQLNGFQASRVFPKIKACHLSPNCVIVDFSDYNLEIAREKGWHNSFVLLPVMNQPTSRLAEYVPSLSSSSSLTTTANTTQLKPWHLRSYDVVMFGLMTTRRKKILQIIQRNHSNWKIRIQNIKGMDEDGGNRLMGSAYANSKICLVMHSWNSRAGGEYHRLSELAPFGCRFVMEKIADLVAVEPYSWCGGVIFADKSNLLTTMQDVLNEIMNSSSSSSSAASTTSIMATTSNQQAQQALYLDWWKAGIRWDEILPSVLPPSPWVK